MADAPVADDRFQLCIVTETGWRYVDDVVIVVPEEIKALEAIMRTGLSLPPGNEAKNEGRVKAFWKAVAKSMKKEYALGDATWFLRKMERSAPS